MVNEWTHTKDLPPERTRKKVYNYSFNASSFRLLSLRLGYWVEKEKEDNRISPSWRLPVEGRILWRFSFLIKYNHARNSRRFIKTLIAMCNVWWGCLLWCWKGKQEFVQCTVRSYYIVRLHACWLLQLAMMLMSLTLSYIFFDLDRPRRYIIEDL